MGKMLRNFSYYHKSIEIRNPIDHSIMEAKVDAKEKDQTASLSTVELRHTQVKYIKLYRYSCHISKLKGKVSKIGKDSRFHKSYDVKYRIVFPGNSECKQ